MTLYPNLQTPGLRGVRRTCLSPSMPAPPYLVTSDERDIAIPRTFPATLAFAGVSLLPRRRERESAACDGLWIPIFAQATGDGDSSVKTTGAGTAEGLLTEFPRQPPSHGRTGPIRKEHNRRGLRPDVPGRTQSLRVLKEMRIKEAPEQTEGEEARLPRGLNALYLSPLSGFYATAPALSRVIP